MSRRLSLKHLIDVTRLHFRIFPERISVTCKFLIPFTICTSNIVTDSPVFPYLYVHPVAPAALDKNQEVEPAAMYNSKSHLELGTRYPYLCL